MLYLEQRMELAKVGKFMVEKNLTNNAGGNISMKVDEDETYNYFVLSPKQAGQLKYWNLNPEDVIVLKQDKQTKQFEKIEGTGHYTRETSLHLNIFNECPQTKSIIHAHPYQSMGFVTFGEEVPLACENVMKLIEVPVLAFAPATSPELAQVVKEHLSTNQDKYKSMDAFSFGLRGHGIVMATSSSLDVTLDYLERLEYNSKAINDYSTYHHGIAKEEYPKYDTVGDE